MQNDEHVIIAMMNLIVVTELFTEDINEVLNRQQEVRSEAKSWSGESAVRWDSLKRIVHAVRNHHAYKQLLYQEVGYLSKGWKVLSC